MIWRAPGWCAVIKLYVVTSGPDIDGRHALELYCVERRLVEARLTICEGSRTHVIRGFNAIDADSPPRLKFELRNAWRACTFFSFRVIECALAWLGATEGSTVGCDSPVAAWLIYCDCFGSESRWQELASLLIVTSGSRVSESPPSFNFSDPVASFRQ